MGFGAGSGSGFAIKARPVSLNRRTRTISVSLLPEQHIKSWQKTGAPQRYSAGLFACMRARVQYPFFADFSPFHGPVVILVAAPRHTATAALRAISHRQVLVGVRTRASGRLCPLTRTRLTRTSRTASLQTNSPRQRADIDHAPNADFSEWWWRTLPEVSPGKQAPKGPFGKPPNVHWEPRATQGHSDRYRRSNRRSGCKNSDRSCTRHIGKLMPADEIIVNQANSSQYCNRPSSEWALRARTKMTRLVLDLRLAYNSLSIVTDSGLRRASADQRRIRKFLVTVA